MPDHTITQQSLPQGKPFVEEEPFTVNEIIGQSPGWILRSGMTVLFIVVAIGISMTFVIRYPDKIQAIGVITTADPFKPIVTRSTGIVDTVFVGNNELVSDQAPILYIQNTADRNDVIQCMEQVERLESLITMQMRKFPIYGEAIELTQSKSQNSKNGNLLNELYPWTENLTLGSLQSTFASLDQQVTEFRHYLSREDYELKREAMDREIEEIKYLNEVLEQEKELTETEVSLSKKDVERNRQLYDHGVISEREMERSQATHIGMKKSYLLKGNNMAQNRIRIAGLNQQKTDILATRIEQVQLYQSRISEIILNFKNQYRQWKEQYFVEAPANGRIQLSSDLFAGQTVPAGKSIGYVIPEPIDRNGENVTSNPKYAKVYVPSFGIGKIKTGNRAIIRLEAYPYKEYGTVESHVEEIYPIAEVQENGARIYELHLPLDSVLMTDYGYLIHYSPDMPVQVAIIAKERSLFERIFEQFLNLLHHNLVKPQGDISSELVPQKSEIKNLKSKIQLS